MNLIDALKSGRPIRLRDTTFVCDRDPFTPPTYMNPDSYKDPEWLLSVVHLKKCEILSEEWEVK